MTQIIIAATTAKRMYVMFILKLYHPPHLWYSRAGKIVASAKQPEGGENGKTEAGPVDRGHRRPCRHANPRASHHARADPATARRNDRRYLPAGAQIRTRDQPRFCWPAI